MNGAAKRLDRECHRFDMLKGDRGTGLRRRLRGCGCCCFDCRLFLRRFLGFAVLIDLRLDVGDNGQRLRGRLFS